MECGNLLVILIKVYMKTHFFCILQIKNATTQMKKTTFLITRSNFQQYSKALKTFIIVWKCALTNIQHVLINLKRNACSFCMGIAKDCLQMDLMQNQVVVFMWRYLEFCQSDSNKNIDCNEEIYLRHVRADVTNANIELFIYAKKPLQINNCIKIQHNHVFLFFH